MEFLNDRKPSTNKKALTNMVKTLAKKTVLIQDSNVAAFGSFAFLIVAKDKLDSVRKVTISVVENIPLVMRKCINHIHTKRMIFF
ncbi:hypothetical protein ASF99_15075 [Exiguobacterium sp. Leaf187]|nr:hypothetical protein ASF99_15075 [Exiguobacterium sp. Leaf187]